MNGANHLQESDDAPLHLCPVCLHKIYFAILIMQKARIKAGMAKQFRSLKIADRYKQLTALYLKYGLDEEAKWTSARVEYLTPSNSEMKADE